MHSEVIWQTLAQSGIAILVLGAVAHIVWKRYSIALDEQRADITQLRAEVARLQEQKDILNKNFNERLMDLQESHFSFMKETTLKYESLSREQKQTIQHNTDALQSLQILIKKQPTLINHANQ